MNKFTHWAVLEVFFLPHESDVYTTLQMTAVNWAKFCPSIFLASAFFSEYLIKEPIISIAYNR